MKNAFPAPLSPSPFSGEKSDAQFSRRVRLSSALLSLAWLALLGGCETPTTQAVNSSSSISQENSQKPNELTLREGDVVKISFPGSPSLDTSQTIRRDGKIALALVGEIQAAGFTPAELQADLLKRYSPQLVTKEVTVTVALSSFAVFVTGSVLKPGKIVSDHPVTVLEAIMEAGGFDKTKANLKAVSIIRQNSDGKTQNFTVNLKLVFEGKQSEPFFLRPSDIVYVPERFSMY